MNVGILSLQGGIIEHSNKIKSLGHNVINVKTKNDLDKIDSLIIPGGESTTMGKLLRATNLLIPLKEKIKSGLNTWGTCAGLILLAKSIDNDSTTHLGVMDISVKRNAYGSQLNSFTTLKQIDEVSKHELELIFIRAPYITGISGNTEILCTINNNIVAASEDNLLVTSFHPELTNNNSFHKYFIEKFNQ